MKNAEETTKTVRRSFVVTFSNHPPIRLWGEFDANEVEANKASGKYAPGDYLTDYEDGTLWDGNPQWGHHDICYYITKSGKRLYWASYNSGESYGGRDPRTTRTFLKTAKDIENYLQEIDAAEWYRIAGRVDAANIVDSDLL